MTGKRAPADLQQRRRSQRSGGNIIGIDLGSTKSCVAILDGGRAAVVQNPEGQRTTPLIVAFTDRRASVGAFVARISVGLRE